MIGRKKIRRQITECAFTFFISTVVSSLPPRSLMKVLEEGDNDGEPSDLLTARLKAQEMVERFFFVIKKKGVK